ncbi:MAG: DUF1003 domain-containing protein [Gaiellaceae bacterium]
MRVVSRVESAVEAGDPFRYLKARRHSDAAGAFGSGGFGAAAENAARFFGTPGYIVGQTIVVAAWVAINTGALLNLVHFDRYPYILLNLAFSLQAAYAAPLILLAQTRQADRDKIHAEADAQHREDLGRQQLERASEIKKLLDQNTELTKKIDGLTSEIHRVTCQPPPISA